MTVTQRRINSLKRDWAYNLIVCLGLAIPAYLVGGLTDWAAIAHVMADALFLLGFLAFGKSYVIADVIPVILVAAVLALVGRAYQAVIEHEQIKEKIELRRQMLDRPIVNYEFG